MMTVEKKGYGVFSELLRKVDPNSVLTREKRNLAVRLHRYGGEWILKRYSIELVKELLKDNGKGYELSDIQIMNAQTAINAFHEIYTKKENKGKGLLNWFK